MVRSLITSLTILLLVGCGQSGTDAVGGPLAMRRLTETQYHNIIADTFGKSIVVAGRFEPESRREGLNAIGSSLVSVSPTGFEQYEAIARSVAEQVLSEESRASTVPCQPARLTGPDDLCAENFVSRYGRQLMRRSLDAAEVNLLVQIARIAAEESGDFYSGLSLSLSAILMSPDFLFRIESGEPAPTPDHPDRLQLSDYTLASRLSFFLWNTGPDEALLAIADKGVLSEPEILEREVNRLLSSPKLADGLRAFFNDLFLFDQFDEISKDVSRYPLYNQRLANDAREQTLRFVVEHLVNREGDYRDLFTSDVLPMTRSLGPLYGVPVRSAEDWEQARFSPRDSRAGLLSHASFAMLHSHPGRSSPTLRGVFLREALLCQTIPEAPADVDFALFSADGDPGKHTATARDRLEIHSIEPSCNKCHVLTDPLGLGLEAFDGIGKYRTSENGVDINLSGDLDGRAFANPVELGKAFYEEPLVSACLVEKMYRYALGREETFGERRFMRHLEKEFETLGYRVPQLMREIVLGESFRTAVSQPVEEAVEETAAVRRDPERESSRGDDKHAT